LIGALEFERDIVRPSFLAFEKAIVKSGHGSKGEYTRKAVDAVCSSREALFGKAPATVNELSDIAKATIAPVHSLAVDQVVNAEECHRDGQQDAAEYCQVFHDWSLLARLINQTCKPDL
jgi:hypothetical protein